MIITHYLKCWPEPFDAAAIGIKTHEVRRQDRSIPYRVGDVLMLREFEPNLGEVEDGEQIGKSVDGEYTGREIRVIVTHITKGFGLPDGVIVMSIRREA